MRRKSCLYCEEAVRLRGIKLPVPILLAQCCRPVPANAQVRPRVGSAAQVHFKVTLPAAQGHKVTLVGQDKLAIFLQLLPCDPVDETPLTQWQHM